MRVHVSIHGSTASSVDGVSMRFDADQARVNDGCACRGFVLKRGLHGINGSASDG